MNRLMRNTRLLAAGVPALISVSFAAPHTDHAHVHGIAALQVAVEGERLTLEFSSPLDNLVGFERAPRTDKEKAAVRQMLERLQKPEELFVPSPEARCVRASVKVDSPVLDAQRAADASASKSGAAPTKDKEKRAGKRGIDLETERSGKCEAISTMLTQRVRRNRLTTNVIN